MIKLETYGCHLLKDAQSWLTGARLSPSGYMEDPRVKAVGCSSAWCSCRSLGWELCFFLLQNCIQATSLAIFSRLRSLDCRQVHLAVLSRKSTHGYQIPIVTCTHHGLEIFQNSHRLISNIFTISTFLEANIYATLFLTCRFPTVRRMKIIAASSKRERNA